MLTKKELRGMIKKETTIAKARKEACELRQRIGYDNCNTYVRCYTCSCDSIISTDLQIELENIESGDYETVYIASIEYIDNSLDTSEFWDSVENCRAVLKTMKNNVIKELKLYSFENISTEDYNM